MKYFLSLFLLIPTILSSADIPAQSKITKVTVFRSGASITRIATVDIPVGSSTITFTELAPNIDQNSIQISATGGFVVLSVVKRNNFLEFNEHSDAIATLLERKKELEGELELLFAEQDVYNKEEQLLLAALSADGKEKKIDIAELKLATAFFREKMTELKKLRIEINAKRIPLQEEVRKINSQLQELNANSKNRSVAEIDVTVQSTRAVKSDVTLTYLTYRAGWQPHYDLRVDKLNDPVEITYAANVQQATGESWENVILTLSTGNPRSPGNKPSLEPWRLRFTPPPAPMSSRVMSQNAARKSVSLESSADMAASGVMELEESQEMDAITVVPTDQNFNATTIEYEISLPYTIESDGKPHSVDIDERQIPAEFEYFAIPKLDRNAYLTAKMSGWEDFYFQPGEANLFLEGTYVGKTYLEIGVEDTLVVSLGRDENIKLNRKRAKEFTKRRTLSRKKTESRGWEIEYRNNKTTSIDLVIMDQIPLSTNNSIEIKSEETGGAEYNEETGFLTWRMTLDAGESASKKFSYQVEYPKNQRLTLE